MANTIVINETPKYSLSVTEGTELQLTLSGTTGPTGAAGPNSITTSTLSNLTGFISANGTTVSGATAGATDATPSTLVLRNANGGVVFTSTTDSAALLATGSNATAGNFQSSTATAVNIFSTSGTGAGITSTSGTGASIGSGTGTAAVIESGTGNHLNIGSGKLIVANNGNTTLTGTIAASNLSGTNTGDQFTAVTSQRLIGRHAGSSGAAQEVTVGDGLEFSGSGIRRSALTGDVTATAGSNATTLASTIAGNKTFSGDMSFTSTTRPTSGGTGTPAATSLITRDDVGISTLMSSVRHWPTHYNLVATFGTTIAAPPGEIVCDSGNVANAVTVLRYSSSNSTNPVLTMPGDALGILNFDRRHRISCEILNAYSYLTTAVLFFTNGASYLQSTADQPALPGFGFKVNSNGIRLWVYGGGAYTEAAATALTNNTIFQVFLDYYGGTLSGTLNGVALASVSGGPSGNSALNQGATTLAAKTGLINERVRFHFRFPKSLTTAS